jgi:hypothetical protein
MGLFEEQQKGSPVVMKALKLLAAAVCGLLIGIGCCGVDAHLHPGAEFGGGAFALFGTAFVVLSALTIVAALIWLLVLGISRLFVK